MRRRRGRHRPGRRPAAGPGHHRGHLLAAEAPPGSAWRRDEVVALLKGGHVIDRTRRRCRKRGLGRSCRRDRAGGDRAVAVRLSDLPPNPSLTHWDLAGDPRRAASPFWLLLWCSSPPSPAALVLAAVAPSTKKELKPAAGIAGTAWCRIRPPRAGGSPAAGLGRSFAVLSLRRRRRQCGCDLVADAEAACWPGRWPRSSRDRGWLGGRTVAPWARIRLGSPAAPDAQARTRPTFTLRPGRAGRLGGHRARPLAAGDRGSPCGGAIGGPPWTPLMFVVRR
jgi:hypothetical protein